MKVKSVNKVLFLALIIIFASIISAFTYNHDNTNDDNAMEVRSLFSWKTNEVMKGRTELFETMEKLKLNTLYQHFSSKLKQEDIESFLLDAKERNIEVYFMDGNPKWSLDENGEHMVRTVDRVIEINQNLDNGNDIKSILFDVEPYLLDEWDEENSEKIMDGFVRGMEIAYKKANENNLEVITCIPYYYDSMGFTKQLEELIKTGCDSIAIMNYFRTNEAKHIKQEVEFADKYGKNVINIYELQAPGKHGLVDKNTYYKEGTIAVEKSFNNIRKEHYGKDISIAFHEYRAVKEVLRNE